MKIKINNKPYQVKEAHTDEEKSKGLSNLKELPKDEKGVPFKVHPSLFILLSKSLLTL